MFPPRKSRRDGLRRPRKDSGTAKVLKGIFEAIPSNLLKLDLGADLLQSGLDLSGVFLGGAFLDRLGRAFDEILGFLEAQAGDGADFLDDFDLLIADGDQNNGELGLLFHRSGGDGGSRASGDRDGGGGRDAPLLFEQLGEFSGFQHGQGRELFNDLFEISHFNFL